MSVRLSFFDHAQVFLRSMFLQASWNPKGMQNLGLAYALYPVLKKLYPRPEDQTSAVQRHLSFFNTHPYVAAAIVGGVVHHEKKISDQLEGPQQVTSFKAALMGPLAALGDGFFWLSFKPAVGALCAALVPFIRAWAVVLFLVLYNAVHLWMRARFYAVGLRLGDKLVDEIARADLPGKGALLRKMAAAFAGTLGAWIGVYVALEQSPSTTQYGVAGGVLVLSAAAYWLTLKRVSHYVVFYLAAAIGTLTGWLLDSAGGI